MLTPSSTGRRQRGVTLIEVLVTILILAFGLLGLAGLQGKMQLVDVESHQRSQAILLVQGMSDRVSANRGAIDTYVAAGAIGTGDEQPASCAEVPAGAERDICEWSNALKGAGEQKGSGNVGAMLDARGCIAVVQAPNPDIGTCTPGTYMVTVTWQGLHSTVAPATACPGDELTDSLRSVSSLVTIGLPSCF